MATTIQLVVGLKDESEAVVTTEVFHATVKIAGSASDTSITLGTLTVPKFVAIYGAAGISMKIGGGADSIPCDPFSILSNSSGEAMTAVLLSNSTGQEVTVYIYAEE